MDWINYHHLLYFWVVAREGGLVQAGKVLRLSHPTLSAQVHALEDQLGHKLFVKVGRRLVLTDVGRVAFRYADEIFTLGRELADTLRGRPTGQPLRLDVGVVDAVPKLIVRRLLAPALALGEPVRLVVHEDRYQNLLAELSLHNLDIVIADAPLPPGSSVRAFAHPLGHTGVGIFGTARLARRHGRDFPAKLDGAPMLLPLEGSPLRRALNQWFDERGVRPTIVGEFEDSALLKAFGGDGLGLFPAPLAASDELAEQLDLVKLGDVPGVRERFYAVSVERRLKHPGVVAITRGARTSLLDDPAATE